MAENELTPKARFHNAEQYLIELLRLYRNETILTYDYNTGKPILLYAMYSVKYEMQTSRLSFPFDEAHRDSDKVKKRNMRINNLSILFHRAMIEYKRAFANLIINDEGYEEFAQQLLHDADARYEWMKEYFYDAETANLVPFFEDVDRLGEYVPQNPEEASALEVLKDIGVRQVSQGGDVRMILYGLCLRGRLLNQPMINVIVAISDDKERTRKYLEDSKYDLCDFITKSRKEERYFTLGDKEKYERRIEILENTIQNLKDRHKLCRSKSKYARKLTNKLLGHLRFSDSRFFRSFNFEEEADRLEYIRWFETANHNIKMASVRGIQHNWPFSPEAWDQFYNLVEQHNAKFTDDDEDDNNNN